MDVQPGLSLIIFSLLCIPLSFPMKDSCNTASILLLPLLLGSFSPCRLSHLHERIRTRFTDENQLLWTGVVDHVYFKEARKKGGITMYLEGQFMSLRRILLFHCTMARIVCIISAVTARDLGFSSVIQSVLSSSLSSCHLESVVLF